MDRRDNIVPFPRRPEMSLEDLETTCRNYLRQSRNPLVPISTLWAYLAKQPGLESTTESDLTGFLNKHDEFDVVVGPAEHEDVSVEVFAAAGIVMGPRVILKTRIPAAQDLALQLKLQLDTMEEVLGAALMDALGSGNEVRAQELRVALERAKSLRKKLPQ